MARVMVVDDRSENRALVKALLEPLGHQVVEAASGAEALKVMASWRPDLLVADVLMPGMDGFEMLRQLGALPLNPRPQVLFWTAYFHSGTARELAKDYGAAAVLAKPSGAKELLAAIEGALALAPSPSRPDPSAHLSLVTDTLARAVDDLDRAKADLGAEARRREDAEAALRRRELQLLQAQKLEAIGRLASGVAHDFNNLLQIIHTSVTEAQELSGDRSEAAQPLQTALDAVQRAAGLCRHLVAMGKDHPGRYLPMDLSALAVSTRELLSTALRKGQHLSLDMQLPAWVQADKVQMEQVLLNLVLNARDACDHSGHIHVQVLPVTLEGDDVLELPGFEPGRYAQLEVRDDGPGIPSEVQAHLFEAYFTTKPQGSGLGLATVHAIVQRHGGRIQVESRPGQGSLFRVLLPLAAAWPGQGSADLAPADGPPTGFRVVQGGVAAGPVGRVA